MVDFYKGFNSRRDFFTDFLEMAEYLISNGYKDPAAVMAGSVLEEHLRQLCKKESIDTEETKEDRQVPKKADRLNADLAKAEVYSKLDHKADHGLARSPQQCGSWKI